MTEENHARSDGCGCMAVPWNTENYDEEGYLIGKDGGMKLAYCPLHAHAPELYEALKETVKEIEGEYAGTEWCSRCGGRKGQHVPDGCNIGEWQALLRDIEGEAGLIK